MCEPRAGAAATLAATAAVGALVDGGAVAVVAPATASGAWHDLRRR